MRELEVSAECEKALSPAARVSLSTPALCKKKYRKIQKISPGAYIFQRRFLRGLFLEGPIYGGKFAFQNRLG